MVPNEAMILTAARRVSSRRDVQSATSEIPVVLGECGKLLYPKHRISGHSRWDSCLRSSRKLPEVHEMRIRNARGEVS